MEPGRIIGGEGQRQVQLPLNKAAKIAAQSIRLLVILPEAGRRARMGRSISPSSVNGGMA